MGVAIEQNVDVAEMESQLLHARLDQRHGPLVATVDQDVSARSRDEKRSQIVRAYIVYVADNVVRRERSVGAGEPQPGQPQDNGQSQDHFKASSMRSDNIATNRS